MISYSLTFKKIENNHDKLRDDSIAGTASLLPTIGLPFIMYAKPRDSGDIRVVNTSVVTEIITEETTAKIITFKTRSGSIYSVILK